MLHKLASSCDQNFYHETLQAYMHHWIYTVKKTVNIINTFNGINGYKTWVRRDWRYQRFNRNPQIEGQTTQWSNEKGQKDKQRSTKHTHKSKDRVTRKPLKTEGLVVSVRFRIFNLLENNVVNRRKQQCMLSTAIIRQRKSSNLFCTLQL